MLPEYANHKAGIMAARGDVPVDFSYIGKRITELRLARGISEYQMSLELGLSKSYIQGITSGKNMPSVRQLFNIADYFEISLSDFFAEDNGTPVTPTQLEAIRAIHTLSDDDVRLIMGIVKRFQNSTD